MGVKMEQDWNKIAGNFLKAEMKRKGFTYDLLQQKLALLDVNDSTNSIKNKVCRGTFQFAFFLQCAKAMGIEKIQLD